MKFRHPVLFVIIAIIGIGMINSLFQDPSKPPDPVSNNSNVNKPIALKELVIGMDIRKIKNAKKLSNKIYMFDIDYFGGKRFFRASTNEEGVIYQYEATLDGSFESLKNALEEKLTADNAKPVIFSCNTNNIKPDSSAEISTRSCKVSGRDEVLIIEEMKMQPTVKHAGFNQIPTIVLSIKLEGIVLSEKSEAVDEKARADAKRTNDALRKKDI